MPPMSNVRKSSTMNSITTAESHPNPQIQSLYQPRRTASGRAIHRPANYYARSFPTHGNAADNDANASESLDAQPHGFFPALQYFTDAITALPKEVMKQFTLMKEAEAKICGPSEHLVSIIDALMAQPVPMQKQIGPAPAAGTGQGLLSFTANNSISGSASASVVNGVAGRSSIYGSVNGSVNGEEFLESPDEIARRAQFRELCNEIKSMLPNMDEKIGVLEEANRVLALQQMRLDEVIPHVNGEISEEARLGSMTHWAYSDNRQKKQPVNAANARGRDVAAANSLAAAASLIHENDISNARINAGREATREKTKGKRAEHPVESDFDERPKKQKIGKSKAAANVSGPASLGLSANGETVLKKKKMAEKGLSASGMERTASTTGRGSKATKDTPRNTPLTEQTAVKKAPKIKAPAGPPKRKPLSSAQASPMLASSPLASSFSPALAEAITSSRPQSTRLRHNSTASNLRHDKLQDGDASNSRPASAVGRANGSVSGTVEKAPNKRKANDNMDKRDEKTPQTVEQQKETQSQEMPEKLKHEDIEMPDALSAIQASAPTSAQVSVPSVPQSNPGSNSQGKGSGRGSAADTPKTDSFPANHSADAASMVRTRSTRSKPNARGDGQDSSSSEGPGGQSANRHRRAISNSHLVKQLAPFNRSPDLDRHRSRDDMDDDVDHGGQSNVVNGNEHGDDIAAMEIDARPTIERAVVSSVVSRRASARKPPSRRNTGGITSSPPWSRTPAGAERDNSPGNAVAAPVATSPPPPPKNLSPSIKKSQSASQAATSVSAAPQTSSSAFDLQNAIARPVTTSEDVPELESDNRDTPTMSEAASDAEDEEEEDDEDDHDPDDPNEQKYCYCNRGSYGEMVACDNHDCPREWFHLGCTELKEAPGEEEVWFCRECRPRPTPRLGSSTGTGARSKTKGAGGGAGGRVRAAKVR